MKLDTLLLILSIAYGLVGLGMLAWMLLKGKKGGRV